MRTFISTKWMFIRSFLGALALFFLFLGASPNLHAQATWSGGHAGDPLNWNQNANWGGVGNYPNSSSVTATFGNSANQGTVTFTGSVTVSGINFTYTSGSYSLNTGAQTLSLQGFGISDTSSGSSKPTLTVGSGGTLSLLNSASLGSIAYTNNGTVSLGGSSTAGSSSITNTSGATVIFAGTASGGTANLTNNTGGVLNLSGSTAGSVTLGSVQGGGNISLGANNLTTGGSNTSGTISGLISGTGTLTKTGSGSLTLTGTNTYSGGTSINSGILNISNNSNLGIGIIEFNGGTLQTGASLAVTNNVTLTSNNGTVDTNGFNSAFSGVMSGSGGLTKTGSGALTLAGINTYTGLTDISNGSLVMGVTSALPLNQAVSIESTGVLNLNGYTQLVGSVTGSGGVSLGSGVLAIYTNTSDLFSGVIGGTGPVAMDGSGSLTLSGTNTYSGGTYLNNGILSVGSASNWGTGNLYFGGGTLQVTNTILTPVNLTLNAGGGTLDTNGNVLCIGGTVSGTGALTKVGSGALTLLGANTYSGGTNLNGGTIDVGNDNNLGVTTGNLTFNGGTLQTTAGIISSRAVSLAGNGTFDTNGFNSTLSGVISGAGSFTKLGTGTLTLDGVNTYTGGTDINNGTLLVGDAAATTATLLGPVTVDTNGYLGGYGTVSGSVSVNGTIKAAAASQTLNITTLNMGPNAVLVAEAMPGDNQSGRLLTTNASLGGSVSIQGDAGAWGIRYDYVVLTASGAVSNTFSGGVTSSLSFMSPTLYYGANAVTVVLTRNNADFTALGSTFNEKALGLALNQSISPSMNDTFGDKLNELYLLSSSQQATALQQMGGSSYASLSTVMINNGRYANSVLMQGSGSTAFPLALGLQNVVSDPLALAQSSGAAGRPSSGGGHNGLWVEGLGGSGTLNSDGNAVGYSISNYGFVAGYDMLLMPGLKGGLCATYSHSTLTSSDSGTVSTNVDNLQVGAYGRKQFGKWDVMAVAQYGFDTFKANRTVSIGTDSAMASSNYSGNGLTAAVQGSYTLLAGNFAYVRPLLGLQYTGQWQPAFTETGADTLDLSVGAQNYTSIRPMAGVNAFRGFALGKDGVLLTPSVTATVSQEVGNVKPQITANLSGAPNNSFTVIGVGPDATLFGASVGLQLTLKGGFNVYGSYNAVLGNTQSLSSYGGGLSYGF